MTVTIRVSVRAKMRRNAAMLLLVNDKPACQPMTMNAIGMTSIGTCTWCTPPASSIAAVRISGPSVAGIGSRIRVASPVPMTIAPAKKSRPTHHGDRAALLMAGSPSLEASIAKA